MLRVLLQVIRRDLLLAVRQKADVLDAGMLFAYIRQDIGSNLLVVTRKRIGPLSFDAYRFLDAKRYWAWFAPGQRQAGELVDAFRKHYRMRRLAVM